MEKTIIALRGKGNSGKSTTIRIFAEMLQMKGYTLAEGVNFPQIKMGRTGKPKDFWQIFEVNGVRIGVTSSGDTYKIVRDQLKNLIMHNCEICFCACRTFDKKTKGTNAAIEENIGYSKEYLPKTEDSNKLTQAATNRQDALEMLKRLDGI